MYILIACPHFCLLSSLTVLTNGRLRLLFTAVSRTTPSHLEALPTHRIAEEDTPDFLLDGNESRQACWADRITHQNAQPSLGKSRWNRDAD
jgi:hypothetical protein